MRACSTSGRAAGPSRWRSSTSGPTWRWPAATSSADALAVARANGERLGLAVAWHRADLLTGAGGPWDAVVANPPYVAEADLRTLAPEIVHHEPRAALEAGEDGLEVISRLVAELAEAGVPWVALEVGHRSGGDGPGAAGGARATRAPRRATTWPGSRASWSPGGRDRGRRPDLRALHARARRRGVSRRHRLRARVRAGRAGGGRAPVPPQGPPARQAGRGDVLRA